MQVGSRVVQNARHSAVACPAAAGGKRLRHTIVDAVGTRALRFVHDDFFAGLLLVRRRTYLIFVPHCG